MDAELKTLLREQADIMRPTPERDAILAAVEGWINANDLDLDLAGVVRLTLQAAINAGWTPPAMRN